VNQPNEIGESPTKEELASLAMLTCMTPKSSRMQKLAQVLPNSIYLATLEAVITRLSNASMSNQWQRWIKRRLGVERSPMWAAEVYQLGVLVSALVLLASLPSRERVPGVLRSVITVVAAYRLIEIMLFALHWVFVDRRPVKDFRRSLLAFCLNLLELALFTTLILFYHAGGYTSTRWRLLYELSSSVFSQSLPTTVGDDSVTRILLHVAIVEAWLLLLVVLAVVVSGITRGELGKNDTTA